MLDCVFALYMEAAGFPKYCRLPNKLRVVIIRSRVSLINVRFLWFLKLKYSGSTAVL